MLQVLLNSRFYFTNDLEIDTTNLQSIFSSEFFSIESRAIDSMVCQFCSFCKKWFLLLEQQGITRFHCDSVDEGRVASILVRCKLYGVNWENKVVRDITYMNRKLLIRFYTVFMRSNSRVFNFFQSFSRISSFFQRFSFNLSTKNVTKLSMF